MKWICRPRLKRMGAYRADSFLYLFSLAFFIFGKSRRHTSREWTTLSAGSRLLALQSMCPAVVCSFTGMGLIARMDYRNGLLYVSRCTIYLIFEDIISATDKQRICVFTQLKCLKTQLKFTGLSTEKQKKSSIRKSVYFLCVQPYSNSCQNSGCLHETVLAHACSLFLELGSRFTINIVYSVLMIKTVSQEFHPIDFCRQVALENKLAQYELYFQFDWEKRKPTFLASFFQ